MRNPLLWLAGADPDILALCPRSERIRLSAMGGAVLTTGMIAAFAATFTTHAYLGLSLRAAVVIGFLWGLAILNLDRWLVVSLSRQSSPARTLAFVVPRVALALVAGLVIAEPLVLRVFENEVTAQAVTNRLVVLAQGRAKLDRQYAQIPPPLKQRNALEHRLTTARPDDALTKNAQYVQLRHDSEALDARATAAQQRALCEFDGTCGTRHAGDGPVYAARRAAADVLSARAAAQRQSLRRLRQK